MRRCLRRFHIDTPKKDAEDANSASSSYRAAFAHLCAEAAAHAFCSVEGDLGVEVDRLRIGAPAAVQTAALEKDCGAHPSAVMNGALLNVYYSPSQFFHINLPSIFI